MKLLKYSLAAILLGVSAAAQSAVIEIYTDRSIFESTYSGSFAREGFEDVVDHGNVITTPSGLQVYSDNANPNTNNSFVTEGTQSVGGNLSPDPSGGSDDGYLSFYFTGATNIFGIDIIDFANEGNKNTNNVLELTTSAGDHYTVYDVLGLLGDAPGYNFSVGFFGFRSDLDFVSATFTKLTGQNGDSVYFDNAVFGQTTSVPGQVPAVPEPSTYALMLGGLGLVGFMAARRKKAENPTA